MSHSSLIYYGIAWHLMVLQGVALYLHSIVRYCKVFDGIVLVLHCKVLYVVLRGSESTGATSLSPPALDGSM